MTVITCIDRPKMGLMPGVSNGQAQQDIESLPWIWRRIQEYICTDTKTESENSDNVANSNCGVSHVTAQQDSGKWPYRWRMIEKNIYTDP